jgi:exodeoxyribonuclease VII large subunit
MQEEAVSVSELTHAIKGLLEEGIGSVVVVGELSNFKHHTSGHRYFTLKDATSQIPCVMWRSRTPSFRPEDGMRVVVTGKVTVYAAQGKYQLDCISMQPEGIGDLYVAFEKLKRDLAERGYFDPSHKRRIPTMPQRIGIATSETGAAVRDMISTIERRFPAVTIVLRPTLVQGEGASADIAQAIRDLEAARVDVMIVGRGGGSIEDLWSFNTLEVADAIFASAVPIISAVGHETDVTIADFVADVRADAMSTALADHISHLSEIAGSFADGRALRRITERMQLRAQRILDLSTRISSALLRSIQLRRREIDSSTALLTTLHPLAPLSRGYAVVERNGQPLGMDHVLEPGDIVQVRRQTETSTVLVQSTQPSTLQSKQ